MVADGLVVAGIDDPTFLGGRGKVGEAVESALAGRPEGMPVVLLAHQPVGMEDAGGQGVDLALCGHTHGGQLPPFQLLNRIAYPFVQGMHPVGGTRVYVSRGTGYWGPPVRVFAAPEVTRFTLRSGTP